MAWDDAKRAKAVEMYLEMEPTPSTSTECFTEVAAALGESPNGVRAILVKAEVYVKKEEAAKASTSKGSKEGSTPRVSKEDAQNTLIAAIEAAGKTVDADIIAKLTGKAAVYFAGLFS